MGGCLRRSPKPITALHTEGIDQAIDRDSKIVVGTVIAASRLRDSIVKPVAEPTDAQLVLHEEEHIFNTRIGLADRLVVVWVQHHVRSVDPGDHRAESEERRAVRLLFLL